MNKFEYLEVLKNRYYHFFDLYHNYYINNTKFQLLASYNIKAEKYMFSKDVKIYTVEQNEHALVKLFNHSINLNQVKEVIETVKNSINELVEPHPDHMKTVLTCVIVTEHSADKESKDFISRFRYQKPFLFYFKGWCELRMVLIDLNNKELIYHPKDKEVVNLYKLPETKFSQNKITKEG
ncbi:hypothetical protein [Natranaerobius trueperi]|uniref:DUF8052 domain-containing protein n=1 Tax=Natranaerobius trueperi TaxID=759412 RepID=A0A226BZU9_9FIRM|nr:hypothetical protein [Natranaerobius trueperi]OWZ84322.1 hypothetical protein CDO51_03400 [Natranaerobius trueperi]